MIVQVRNKRVEFATHKVKYLAVFCDNNDPTKTYKKESEAYCFNENDLERYKKYPDTIEIVELPSPPEDVLQRAQELDGKVKDVTEFMLRLKEKTEVEKLQEQLNELKKSIDPIKKALEGR